jgi:hypothetical protein
MNIHTIKSIAVIASAAFLGACTSLPQHRNDKVVNSNALADCSITALRTVYRDQFEKTAKAEIAASTGKSADALVFEAMTAEGLDKKSESILMSCISKISGVAPDKVPDVHNQPLFSPWYESYFDSPTFQAKAMDDIIALHKEMDAEGLAFFKQRLSL